MSLSSALSAAKSSLSATSQQTANVARNIAGAGDPNYSKRISSLSSGQFGTVRVSLARTADEALMGRLLTANSEANRSSILSGGLDRLSSIYSAKDHSGSPAALLSDFQNGLQIFASAPSNAVLGDTAVSKAQSLARALNEGGRQIEALRSDADQEIGAAVSNVNALLSKFEKANQTVVNGSRTGKDVSEAMDQRDTILKQLAGEMGIKTMTRGDNDMVIVSSNGAILFETVPRKVEFQSTLAFGAGSSGGMVSVDGTPLSHDSFDQPFGTGRLSGLLQLRDEIAPRYQLQLDEIARGLINAFAEHDPQGGGAAQAGLFNAMGFTEVPIGAPVAGLAQSLHVSSAFVASQGGSSTALRDGLHFNYNDNNAAGFADRLLALKDGISKPVEMTNGSGEKSKSGLIDYSTSAISWLEGKRSTANTQLQYHTTIRHQSEVALSNITGVDTDSEMALLLELEHTYQASGRVLATVNSMLEQLLRVM